LETSSEEKHLVHTVVLSYGEQKEAVLDKSGKAVKEMVLQLQQIDRQADLRVTHEFSFASQDFERMADKDFEVVSYF
jgi:hypothetical protein